MIISSFMMVAKEQNELSWIPQFTGFPLKDCLKSEKALHKICVFLEKEMNLKYISYFLKQIFHSLETSRQIEMTLLDISTYRRF